MGDFRRRGVALGLIALVAFTGASQEAPEPEPYDPQDFPRRLRDLRRAEIIAVGSFPITFVFTNLAYGLIRYAVNGFDNEYAPLGNPNPYAWPETVGVMSTAAGLSVSVAIADLLIGRRRERRRDTEPDGSP